MENASFCPLVLWICKKILENVFSIKIRNITYQTLQMRII